MKLFALDKIADEVGRLGTEDKVGARRHLVGKELFSECDGDLNSESSDSFQQHGYMAICEKMAASGMPRTFGLASIKEQPCGQVSLCMGSKLVKSHSDSL